MLVPAALHFRGREHRGATDVVNMALNYGYGFLLNQVWLAVYRAGLEASIGLLHTSRRRTPGLVFDLMEPYRQPVVDRTVLSLVGKGARLTLNDKGQLSLRTRGLLQRAFVKRLTAGKVSPDMNLLRRIQREGHALRRSLLYRKPYRAYRMSW